jgi:membrane protein required for colicin V production
MEVAAINVTDVVVLLVLVISGVFAFFRGFVHELMAVVSWIGAAIVTLYAFPLVQPEIRKIVAAPLIADIGTGVGLYLAVLIVLSILTRIVSRRVRDSALGPLDRSLGLLFGFLRGAVLVSIAWLALAWVLPREDHPDWITKARSLPLIQQSSVILVGLVPDRLRGQATEAFQDMDGGNGQNGTAERNFQDLLSPIRKGGASQDKAGYNEPERDQMQRLIEGITGAEEPAR